MRYMTGQELMGSAQAAAETALEQRDVQGAGAAESLYLTLSLVNTALLILADVYGSLTHPVEIDDLGLDVYNSIKAQLDALGLPHSGPAFESV
jgi:predicted DNA repair protein MutK